MNREEIIRMARETGVEWLMHNQFYKDHLQHFAALIASRVAAAAKAEEREACEALHQHEDVLAPVGNSAWGEAYQEGWAAGTAAYRDAIRARGQA